MSGASSLAPVGSSPLTRGKPVSASRCLARLGLIPAHAGKTEGMGQVRMIPTAHPRSRGENMAVAGLAAAGGGSSPLTRGKPHLHRLGHLALRLIPAHAGKTEVRSVDEEARSAHPRSRGENSATGLDGADQRGSSPLTRGKRVGVTLDVWQRGLIPAHAGKTGASLMVRTPLGAHPRSRGENHVDVLAGKLRPGSSPLTRGKQGHGPHRRRS